MIYLVKQIAQVCCLLFISLIPEYHSEQTQHHSNGIPQYHNNCAPVSRNRLMLTMNKVLLISMDGFRWDFRKKAITPNLDEIVNAGVHVKHVKNVFPSSTLPNHQSIVTGLYPENHGIIANTFFNASNGRIFNGQTSESDWWNQSTPIWIDNQKQGHKSGVCFWPGYRVKYGNITPDYLPSRKYDAPYLKNEKIMPISRRINLVVDWLKRDDVNFVALYTNHVDVAAHSYSPDSNQAKNQKHITGAVLSVDRMIGNLKRQLKKSILTSSVNVILIGDHGFVNTDSRKVIRLDRYINSIRDLAYINGVTNMFLYTKPNRTSFVYEKLKSGSLKPNSHFKVYLKKDIPNNLHIKNSYYTPPILMAPDPGWVIRNRKTEITYLKGKWQRGEHGYDISERKTHPAFFAFGPVFKKGYWKKYIETVDIYSLMCSILGLKMDERDGSYQRIKSLLV